MFESVVKRKYNSSFFNSFGNCFEFFVFSSAAIVMPGIFVNFLVRISSFDSENICFMMFIFACSAYIKHCFIPCNFFEKNVYLLAV